MKFVLAEKKSVAQSLAKVLGATNRREGYLEGNGYLVSWCVGHLLELGAPESYGEVYRKWAYETLPIVPQMWKYQVIASTKKQFSVITTLMQREDVKSIVCATDAGREGELIFRLVYEQCGCRKNVERLWISSMEDAAIRAGFENLRPGSDYDRLYKAALCRERADWLVGINATRLFSTLYGQTLNVGRVMTPTLAMAVERESSIAAFHPERFFTLELMLDGFSAVSERMNSKEEARRRKEASMGLSAIIKQVQRKEKTVNPPALYDLTTLQREANRILGFTAQQTLDYVQALYEKKLCTYPRTDSRYLTDDMTDGLPGLVETIYAQFGVEGVEKIPVHAENVVNSRKVTDHHAIIPTREAALYHLEDLPSGELEILKMIALRLFCAVGEPYRYLETTAELDCGSLTTTAKGKTVLSEGWKALERRAEAEEEPLLPALSQGDSLHVRAIAIKEGKTTPPRHFTEDTLLAAMETAGDVPEEAERKGLGTPATRAAIIEKLVNKGFLQRKGEQKTQHLIPTQKGTALITVMPAEIQSPAMTADWEEKLLRIERGDYDAEAFLQEIQSALSNLIRSYRPAQETKFLLSGNPIGVCPVCGSPVEEKELAFFCRSCKFALWKNNRYFESIGKTLTPNVAQKLLRQGRVRLKNCKSRRTGKDFDATVVMTVGDTGKPEFQMEFEQKGEKHGAGKSETLG